MKRILLICGFMMLSFFGFAQPNPQGSNIINIPIYTLKEGIIEVPISLVYNGSGVKVNQTATQVGLGWDLKAGAKIVREIRDLPDEYYNSSGFRMDGHEDAGGIDQFGRFFETDSSIYENQAIFRDKESDIFKLILDDKVITFTLKETLNSERICYQFSDKVNYLSDNQDIKIEYLYYAGSCIYTHGPIPNSIVNNVPNNASNFFETNISNLRSGNLFRYFRATLPNGVQYYFGENPESRDYIFSYESLANTGFCMPELPSLLTGKINSPLGWNVSRIVYPKGISSINLGPNVPDSKFNEVKFEYKRTQEIIPSNYFKKPWAIFGPECKVDFALENDIKKWPLIYGSEISKIIGTNLEIEFNSNEIFQKASLLTGTSNIPGFNVSQFTDTNKQDSKAIFDYPTQVGATFRYVMREGGVNIPFEGGPNLFLNSNIIPRKSILKNILIKDKISSNTKGYYMDYSYFQKYEYTNSNRVISNNGRLKLKGIYELKLGTLVNIEPGYRFEYNNLVLPEINSFASDHWGYYNGEDENINKSGLITLPSREILTKISPQVSRLCISTTYSNLDANLNYNQAGILIKMYHPTGGNEEYIYECNNAYNYFSGKALSGTIITKVDPDKNIGGVRLKSISSYDPIFNKYYIKEYEYRINSSSSGVLQLWPNYFYNYYDDLSSRQATVIIPNMAMEIFNRESISDLYFYKMITERDFYMQNDNRITNGKIEYFYYLHPGDDRNPYQIYNVSNSEWVDDYNDFVGIAYSRYRNNRNQFIIPNYKNGILTGIKQYNSADNLVSETNFEYECISSNYKGYTQYYLRKPFNFRMSQTIDFCSRFDLFDNYREAKIDWKAALISATAKTIAQQAAVYTLVSSGAVTTTAAASALVSGVVIIVTILIGIINANTELTDCTNYTLVPYSLNQNWVRLREKQEIQYYGGNNITSKTFYMYDASKKHNQVISELNQIFSNNVLKQSTENLIKYSSEYTPLSRLVSYTPEANALRLAINKRMLVPVEAVTKLNGKVISGSYFEYQNNVINSGMLSKSYNLEIENPLSSFTMSSVVSNGSTTSISKNNNYVPNLSVNSFNAKGLPTEIQGIASFKDGSNVLRTVNDIKSVVTYTNNDLDVFENKIMDQSSQLLRISRNVSSPLFGVTESTLPNNDIVRYVYDELGRIVQIKDRDNNILKSYFYRTSNQIGAATPSYFGR